MTKLASLLTLLATVLVCLLPAAPAWAQRDRVFVASYGSDSNPCTFGSPCKTFQNAVNVVAAGGEVTAIDSAGFGTIAISHSVTITSPNGVEAGIAAPASGAAAITINAQSSDIVSLNGLTLDGDNVANTIGILFSSGGSLNIQNCVVRNFTLYGIIFEPNASGQLFVLKTLVSDNSGPGITISGTGPGTVLGVLDDVALENNVNNGLNVIAGSSQTVNLTVSDSVSANNGEYGIEAFADGGTVNTMVRTSTIANNGGYGLFANNAGAQIWVTRSTITGNFDGWGYSGGALVTYGDNNNVGNAGASFTSSSIGYE
jgi:hypothetical protein